MTGVALLQLLQPFLVMGRKDKNKHKVISKLVNDDDDGGGYGKS